MGILQRVPQGGPFKGSFVGFFIEVLQGSFMGLLWGGVLDNGPSRLM